jgi:hypothetical protein
MKIKTTNKICDISKYVVFYYKIPTTSLILPKIVCLIILLFPKSSPFWAIPSHIIMIENEQEFNIQNYNVP